MRTGIAIRIALLSTLATAVAAGGAGAQAVSGGLQSGVALASFLNRDAPAERRVGLRLGAFLEMDFATSLDARVEAVYATKGMKGADSDVTVALDYLEVPLLAKFAFPGAVAPAVFTGPAVGIKLAAEHRSGAGAQDYGDLVKRFDVGWVVGAGLEILYGRWPLLLDVRYTRGLTAVFDFGDPSDSDSDDMNQVISVGLGLTLFGGRP